MRHSRRSPSSSNAVADRPLSISLENTRLQVELRARLRSWPVACALIEAGQQDVSGWSVPPRRGAAAAGRPFAGLEPPRGAARRRTHLRERLPRGGTRDRRVARRASRVARGSTRRWLRLTASPSRSRARCPRPGSRPPHSRVRTAGSTGGDRGGGVLRRRREPHQRREARAGDRRRPSTSAVKRILLVEIVDDGVGGADTERGSGLRGLADRVEALDGRLQVWTPRGGGTR